MILFKRLQIIELEQYRGRPDLDLIFIGLTDVRLTRGLCRYNFHIILYSTQIIFIVGIIVLKAFSYILIRIAWKNSTLHRLSIDSSNMKSTTTTPFSIRPKNIGRRSGRLQNYSNIVSIFV